MRQDELSHVLENHIPARAVDYCVHLWKEHPFRLSLRKARKTKLGDFSWRPGHAPHITVNADSHSYLFLLTYIHEVAHHRVQLKHGRRVAPHGKEWKEMFRELCSPLLRDEIFPNDVALVLKHHMENPKASSLSDAKLSRALSHHDPHLSNAVRLQDIPEGSAFEIRGRWFTRGKLKRSRIVCQEISSRRRYLIAADAFIGQS